MGDRSNVFLQTARQSWNDEWQGIGIYSHWHGTVLHEHALKALDKANNRIGDPSYAARIIVHSVLDALADVNSETGFGLWTDHPDDNEQKILVINLLTGACWYSHEYRQSQREPNSLFKESSNA